MHKYDAPAVRHRGIRAVLTQAQLRELERASQRISYKADEPIFREGDETAYSFIVVSGTLKLTKMHPDGECRVIALMFADDLLCGTFKARQTHSAAAATDLELCAIPHEILSSLCSREPKLQRVLFQAALNELEAGHDWMLLLRGCPAYRRVAGFLQVLASRAQPQPVEQDGAVRVRLTLPLSRDEIAGFLDITRETVSRQMTLMRNRGVIEFPVSRVGRKVIVPDLALLIAHAQSDLSRGPASVWPSMANPAERQLPSHCCQIANRNTRAGSL